MRNKRKVDNDVEIFFGMILASIVALIFWGLIAFIIGGILVCIYLIINIRGDQIYYLMDWLKQHIW